MAGQEPSNPVKEAASRAWVEGYTHGRIEQARLTALQAESSSNWPDEQVAWLQNMAKTVRANFTGTTTYRDNPYEKED